MVNKIGKKNTIGGFDIILIVDICDFFCRLPESTNWFTFTASIVYITIHFPTPTEFGSVRVIFKLEARDYTLSYTDAANNTVSVPVS